MKILFEPWNFGDAIIAAAVARLDPDRFILACNDCWHEVLMLASGGSLRLLSLNLPYVWRTDKKFFSLGEAAVAPAEFNAALRQHVEIISIRGDLRDWFAARRIFRGAAFKFSGWLPFCARKIPLLDWPYKHGCRKVQNRYQAWADAAGIPFGTVERAYYLHPEKAKEAPIVIHVGAQWRSKQYPRVAELAELLNKAAKRVTILAGPNDPLPPGVPPGLVLRPPWPELVAHLQNAGHVITNDSGPMHLAAFLGCRTIALSRCSNILEWLPPGVTALSSPSAPKGYRPIPGYWSDRILPGWPEPEEVAAAMTADIVF